MEKLTTEEVLQMLFDDEQHDDGNTESVAELDVNDNSIQKTIERVIEKTLQVDDSRSSDDNTSDISIENDSDYVPDSQPSSDAESLPSQSPNNVFTQPVIHTSGAPMLPKGQLRSDSQMASQMASSGKEIPLAVLDCSVVAAEVEVNDGSPAICASSSVSDQHQDARHQALRNTGSMELKRRRISNPQFWRKNIKKKKRASGHEYLNYQNKVVAKKRLYPRTCRKHCFEKMNENAQRMFDDFYGMDNKKDQDVYLFGQVDCGGEKKQVRGRSDEKAPRKRSCPYKYHVKLANGERLEICCACFLQVHAIDRSRMRKLMETGNPMSPPPDKRGKCIPANKTSENIILKVRDHIASFAPLKSHYSAADNPNKRYLPENLNIRRMWRMCIKEYEPDAWEHIRRGERYKGKITERVYRNIFNEYSLSFGYPRTDTCGTCDLLKTKLSLEENDGEKLKLEDEKRKHITLADQSYWEMKTDALKAKLSWNDTHRALDEDRVCSNDGIDMYSFDYQQNLMIPNFTHTEMYYSRQLNLFNFGIHDHVNDDDIMCIYPETVAKKGGSEVASCLKKVLEHRKTGAKKCILYSDGCGGQNRNHDMVCFFQGLIQNGQYGRVNHKILLRGHTRLANDRDFGLIQQRTKVERVVVPADLKKVIEESRVFPKPFSAVEMQSQDFMDYRKVSQASIKAVFKDRNGEKVSFSKVRWFSYGVSDDKDWVTGEVKAVSHETEVWCRYTHDHKEDWKKVDILRRGAFTQGLSAKYTGAIELKRAKWNDIQKQIPFIDDLEKRKFYTSLPHEGDEGLTDGDDAGDNQEYCDDSD